MLPLRAIADRPQAACGGLSRSTRRRLVPVAARSYEQLPAAQASNAFG
jgi:hypothetical protein